MRSSRRIEDLKVHPRAGSTSRYLNLSVITVLAHVLIAASLATNAKVMSLEEVRAILAEKGRETSAGTPASPPNNRINAVRWVDMLS